jgi:hypothetical protein
VTICIAVSEYKFVYLVIMVFRREHSTSIKDFVRSSVGPLVGPSVGPHIASPKENSRLVGVSLLLLVETVEVDTQSSERKLMKANSVFLAIFINHMRDCH